MTKTAETTDNKNADVKLVCIMKDNLLWEYQGHVYDGEGDAFKANMRAYLDDMLLEAYRIGYLKNEQTNEVIEAQHIKFLGNKVLNDTKDIAVLLANIFIK